MNKHQVISESATDIPLKTPSRLVYISLDKSSPFFPENLSAISIMLSCTDEQTKIRLHYSNAGNIKKPLYYYDVLEVFSNCFSYSIPLPVLIKSLHLPTNDFEGVPRDDPQRRAEIYTALLRDIYPFFAISRIVPKKINN